MGLAIANSAKARDAQYNAARARRSGTKAMKFRPRRGLTIFVAVFLPLVLSLAAWQDRRAAEKAAFEAKLAASDARWKFVFGHHPMRSNGYWGDVSDVRDALEVILAKRIDDQEAVWARPFKP